MDSAKSMSTRSRAFGRCCGRGCDRTGGFLKRNCRSTWGSSSSSTTSETRQCVARGLGRTAGHANPPKRRMSLGHYQAMSNRRKHPHSMRDVVIGGSGQIDSWLLHWLGERGHEALGTYHSVAYPGLVYLDAAEAETAAAWVRANGPMSFSIRRDSPGWTAASATPRGRGRSTSTNR